MALSGCEAAKGSKNIHGFCSAIHFQCDANTSVTRAT
jgi:hypothetical protein